MKKAFTLIELIFVIIVIGILGALGSEILFKVYENYLISQTLTKSIQKNDAALENIAKRLSFRIPFTEVAIKNFATPNDVIPLSTNDPTYEVLGWIGYAYEARIGEFNTTINYYSPAWSGFIDLGPSTKDTIQLRASNTGVIRTILQELSDDVIDLAVANNGAAVIFKAYPYNTTTEIAYGWLAKTGVAATDVFPVSINSIDRLNFDSLKPTRIYEHAYLTWTAYAIVTEVNSTTNNYDIYLYYNFRPWMNEDFKDGDRSPIAYNVTKFNFRRTQKAIELRMCSSTDFSDEFNVTICGKKVVF